MLKSIMPKSKYLLKISGTLTACSVKYTDDTPPEKVTDYSKVELTPLSYFTEMDGQVYGVRVYRLWVSFSYDSGDLSY